MALQEIYDNLWYFVDLTTRSGVFWAVLPLLIVTILTVIYYRRNRSEKVGWDSYFTNSLILVFVSVDLLRYVYTLGIAGAINYIDNPLKSFAIIFLLIFGLFVSRLNFSHLLPEKLTSYISSPIMVNLVAYIIILYVNSTLDNTWEMFSALLILFVVLIVALNFIRVLFDKLFDYLKRMKRREKISDVKEERFEIEELKRELKYRENKMKKYEFKEVDKERKDDLKIERIIRKKRR